MSRFFLSVSLLATLASLLYQLSLFGSASANFLRFGSEYGNIAECLVTRGQFGDAMAVGSGPTAWMPPALVVLMASVFTLLGSKSVASALFLVSIKSLFLGLGLATFLELVRHEFGRVGVILGLSLTVIGWLCDAHRLYAELDDIWWTNCWALACLIFVIRPHYQQRFVKSWLVFCGLLPLVSPSLTLGLGFALCSQSVSRRSIRPLLGPSLMIVLTTLGWGTRNLVSLGHFYPIKSNMWFDFVESNLQDDDGLLTHSFFRLHHPINQNAGRARYLALGEVAFVEEAHQAARQVEGSQWRKRFWRRLYNATVGLQIDWDVLACPPTTPRNEQLLFQSGLRYRHQGQAFWLFLHRDSEQAVAAQLVALNLDDAPTIISERARAAAALRFFQSTWPFNWYVWHFSLLPTLGAVAVVGRRRWTAGIPTLALYVGYLLPYLLIQHYARYQVSVVWVQYYLVLLGFVPFIHQAKKH